MRCATLLNVFCPKLISQCVKNFGEDAFTAVLEKYEGLHGAGDRDFSVIHTLSRTQLVYFNVLAFGQRV